MKEQITLRLYEDCNQCAAGQAGRYKPDETVKGWDYQRGETIPVVDDGGGFLYAVIDHIANETSEDEQGKYRVATAWTQD